MLLSREVYFLLTLTVSAWFPVSAAAQRVDALKSGVVSHTMPLRQGWQEGKREMTSESGVRPSVLRHSLYGALVGVALWGAYFALPCDAGC